MSTHRGSRPTRGTCKPENPKPPGRKHARPRSRSTSGRILPRGSCCLSFPDGKSPKRRVLLIALWNCSTNSTERAGSWARQTKGRDGITASPAGMNRAVSGEDVSAGPGCSTDPVLTFLEGVSETNLLLARRRVAWGCEQLSQVFAQLGRALVSAARFASSHFQDRGDWTCHHTNKKHRARG